MNNYPLFLSLHAATIVVAGAGGVGRRKVESLLKAGPEEIRIVDPVLAHEKIRAEIAGTVPEGCATTLTFVAEPFTPEILRGAMLVFAATPSEDLNREIAGYCNKLGILCNRADSEEGSDFTVPAWVQSGPISIAVSTGGTSPALARRLREDIEDWLGPGYGRLARLLGRVRPCVLSLDLPQTENARIFRSLAYSQLLDHLESGDLEGAAAELRDILPALLHEKVEEVLHEL